MAGDHREGVTGHAEDMIARHDDVVTGQTGQDVPVEARVLGADDDELALLVGRQRGDEVVLGEQGREPRGVVPCIGCDARGQRPQGLGDHQDRSLVAVGCRGQLVPDPGDLVARTALLRGVPPHLADAPPVGEGDLGGEEQQGAVRRVPPAGQDDAPAHGRGVGIEVDEPGHLANDPRQPVPGQRRR